MANNVEIKDLSSAVIATIPSTDNTLVIDGAQLMPKDILEIFRQITIINNDLSKHHRQELIRRVVFKNCKPAVGKIPAPTRNENIKECGITEIVFEGNGQTLEVFRTTAEIARLVVDQTGGMGQPIKLTNFKSLVVHCGVLEERDMMLINQLKRKLVALDVAGSQLDANDKAHIIEMLSQSPIVKFICAEGNDIPIEIKADIIQQLQKNSAENENKTVKIGDKSSPFPTRIITDIEGSLEVELPQSDGSKKPIDLLSPTLDLSGYKFPENIAGNESYAEALTLLRKANPKRIIFSNDAEQARIRELFGLCLRECDAEEITLDHVKSGVQIQQGEEIGIFISHGYPKLRKLFLSDVDLSGPPMTGNKYVNGPNLARLINDKPHAKLAIVNLEELVLENCRISDCDIANADKTSLALTHLPAASSLRRINLSNNRGIGDNSLISLMKWVADSNIAEINLDGTSISVSGKAEIQNLVANRQGIPSPFLSIHSAEEFLAGARVR